jgi:hypothetical protein
MASTIQIKRGTGSAVPTGLADGELAINLDNRKLYFGSSSTSVNTFRFENLVAENYIVSSSVTNITTQELSGSTIFGNSSDDTHQFTGNITASGDISSSGNIHGTIYNIQNYVLWDNNGVALRLDPGGQYGAYELGRGNMVKPFNIYGPIFSPSHITASGKISASGDGHYFGGRIHTPRIDHLDETERVYIGTGLNVNTNITASGAIKAGGNISSSNNLYGKNSYFPVNGRIYHGTHHLSGDADGSILSSNLTVNGSILNHKIKYDTGSHTSNGVTARGEIVYFGTGTTVAGGIYTLTGSGGWSVADANAGPTATGSLAIAIGSVPSSSGMLLRGMVKIKQVDGAVKHGQPLWLSAANAGNGQTTTPTGNNDIARVIGYTISGSGTNISPTIYFNPDNTWVEVSA